MPQVLNSVLHDRLVKRFERVLIVNPGELCFGHWERDAITGDRLFVRATKGETYAVNCLFCRDNRGRCYISYCCGLQRPDLDGIDTLSWVKCHHEDCLKDKIRRNLFWEHTTGCSRAATISHSFVESSNVAAPELPAWRKNEASDAPWPGEHVPIDRLPVSHPARAYLEQKRGYDVKALVNNYGVSFVTKALPEYQTAQGRILIPVFWGGFLRAWQVRYVGTPANKATAKYFSLPQSKIADMLYCSDYARLFPWAVVVEGAPSVWRQGPPFTATFGSKVSYAQLEIIKALWPNGVVFLHDVDKFEGEDAERKTRDAEIRMEETFRKIKKVAPQSIHLKLNPKEDPADYEPHRLWPWIMDAARAEGWPLFDPPVLKKELF